MFFQKKNLLDAFHSDVAITQQLAQYFAARFGVHKKKDKNH